MAPTAYLNILHLLIHEHDFNQKVLGVRGDRLLANMLYQLTEFHRHPLSALNDSHERLPWLNRHITNLLLVGERTPEHAHALTNHADI